MRMPSGYGSVVKLSGKRRRPFAVRTSTINKYIYIYVGEEPAASVFNRLNRLGFAFKKKQGYWSAIATEKALELADTLSENGVKTRIEFKQAYTFHEYFEKREEAYKYLAKLNSGDVVREHRSLSVAPTFAAVYKEWLDHVKGLKKQLSKGTMDSYHTGFNNLSAIHNIRIDVLRPVNIQPILNKNNTKTQSGVAIIRKVLQKVEDYALMQRYIEDGYMKYLIFEHTDRKDKMHKAFSEDEIRLLWDNLGYPYVDFILTTIYTGLRPTELLTVKTENVHLDKGYMIGGMKTDAGRDRTIPISDRIAPVIKALYDPKREYFYPKHTSYKILQKHFYRCMENLSLSHMPHDGRHTFATLMDRYGANQVCTKMIMGHSLKGNITEGIYTHKELSDLLEAVNMIKI